MWSQQRPEGSSSRLAASLVQPALVWLLKTMLSPVIPFGFAVLTIALVAVLLPLAFLEGTRAESGPRSEVATAIQQNGQPVLSFDGAEPEHKVPHSLATVIVQQVRQEGRHLPTQAVVAALSPRFTYETYVLASLRRVPRETETEAPDGGEVASEPPDQEPDWEEVRTAQTVQALSLAEAYRHTYRYQYRVHRYEHADGWDEHLERDSVTVTDEPERFLVILSDLLGRKVEPWEASWLKGLAADSEADQRTAGQWLLRPEH